MTSVETNAKTEAEGRAPRTRLITMFVACVLVLAIAAGGSQWLQRQAASVDTRQDADPDRIGLNAPNIKTVDVVTEKMIELAELTPDDVVYDLGCGDGRLVIAAALAIGCRGVGFDINPDRVAEARQNVKLNGLEDLVEIRQQDIFTVDLSEADVIVMYLLPWMTRKLIPQFQEMHPGSRIISHDFAMGLDVDYIKPSETATVDIGTAMPEVHRIHKWVTPLKVPPKPEPEA